ncbi:hypothetical protein EVAR_72819_1 [Eumeta japonica]|uniref:Uncharacterized protein n=1 Tax=Eumeta variegata TaxID=151549 RepID=A0A4C1SH58_EUMVA|nr:hypothetical protein EVAR_72819_1 [Eumeta japonica]
MGSFVESPKLPFAAAPSRKGRNRIFDGGVKRVMEEDESGSAKLSHTGRITTVQAVTPHVHFVRVGELLARVHPLPVNKIVVRRTSPEAAARAAAS